MLTTAKQESTEAEVRKGNTTLVCITGAPVVRAGRVNFARQRQGSAAGQGAGSAASSTLVGRLEPIGATRSRTFDLCCVVKERQTIAVRVSPRNPTGACIGSNPFVRSLWEKRSPW
jgi:hypothetical protein